MLNGYLLQKVCFTVTGDNYVDEGYVLSKSLF